MRKDTLRRQYLDHKLTISEIAAKNNHSYEEVVDLLETHNVPLRAPEDSDVWDPDWLHNQYWVQNKTLEAIATEQGVTPPVIMRWMEYFHIPRRVRGSRSATTHTAKLDAGRVLLIRQLDAEGVQQKKIRELLAKEGIDISKQALSKVVRGQTWKDVSV